MKRLPLPRNKWLGVLVLVLAMVATTTQVSAQAGPSMTVTPQSGVRPLTVNVTGTPCALTKPVAGTPGPPVRIVWQVEGNPATQQVRIIPSEAGANWTTTLVLGVPNLGLNVISGTCVGPADEALVTYPPQKVEVLPVPPALSASPTSVTVGESITATATHCPDPELPILGGGYFVRFTLEYLVPPDGTQGPYSESTVVWTTSDGVASTTFTLPSNAPTQGNAYRIRASCELEELGSAIALFSYAPVAIQVNDVVTPTPTPEPTATVLPTVTPTPDPVPTATPAPTPEPTATPGPTSTPWPIPTPTPRPGCCVIIFTG